tara:strand:+ start:131 stop:517 length:387 start_codon:yes stop_codon:yes gene_type:complete
MPESTAYWEEKGRRRGETLASPPLDRERDLPYVAHLERTTVSKYKESINKSSPSVPRGSTFKSEYLFWCVFDWEGEPFTQTVRGLKYEALRACFDSNVNDQNRPTKSWRRLERYGFTVRKVAVTLEVL